MGSESNLGGSSSSSSPAGKRGRDPEDEVYVDNLHSHKRYLSEVEFVLFTAVVVLVGLRIFPFF